MQDSDDQLSLSGWISAQYVQQQQHRLRLSEFEFKFTRSRFRLGLARQRTASTDRSEPEISEFQVIYPFVTDRFRLNDEVHHRARAKKPSS